MKMRKFVVGLVASALVVASMATTVFAAKSPSTDNLRAAQRRAMLQYLHPTSPARSSSMME